MGRTAAQALIEEGKEIGIEIGVEQGALRTRREVLLELIQGKFGSIPQRMESRIQLIRDIDQLKTLTHKIIHASNIDDINIE